MKVYVIIAEDEETGKPFIPDSWLLYSQEEVNEYVGELFEINVNEEIPDGFIEKIWKTYEFRLKGINFYLQQIYLDKKKVIE